MEEIAVKTGLFEAITEIPSKNGPSLPVGTVGEASWFERKTISNMTNNRSQCRLMPFEWHMARLSSYVQLFVKYKYNIFFFIVMMEKPCHNL